MSEKVQEAIAATRAGQKREAQLLLTEALQEDPNDEYAWFLLSNLVDSPEKRKAYLGKALTINPHNEKARQQLTHIQRQAMSVPEEEPVVVMVKEDEATAVVEELSEMPDWLADQLGDDVPEATVADEHLGQLDAIPDEGETAAAEEMAMVQTAVSTPAKADVKSDAARQMRLYNQILILLVVLIIVILIALIWSL